MNLKDNNFRPRQSTEPGPPPPIRARMHHARAPQERRLALITGASSGIGLELARCAAADGYDTALVARREPELAAISAELSDSCGGRHHVIPMDLGLPGASGALAQKLGQLSLVPHVLVNNAGFGLYGAFLDTPVSRHLELIQLNIAALTELTSLLVPHMVQEGWGRVLNVASTAAFQPGPLMASYYASKAYVLSLSEALHEELRGSGVTVTALCPGPVNTGFQGAAGLEASRMAPLFTRTGPGGVAQQGWDGCMKGRAVVIPGILNKVQVSSVRLLPRGAVRRLVRAVQERTKRGR